jgi:hypothetical protein
MREKTPCRIMVRVVRVVRRRFVYRNIRKLIRWFSRRIMVRGVRDVRRRVVYRNIRKFISWVSHAVCQAMSGKQRSEEIYCESASSTARIGAEGKLLSRRASLQSLGSSQASNGSRSASRAEVRRSSIAEVTRGRSASDVLKSSLKELAELDSKFNPAWMPQFLELYFNPVPLNRLCIFQFLLILAVLVDESITLRKECRWRTEQAQTEGIAHDTTCIFKSGELVWIYSLFVATAIMLLQPVLSFVVISSRHMRCFSTKHFGGIVATHLLVSLMGLHLFMFSRQRRRGVLGYRWVKNAGIIANMTFNISYSEYGIPEVSCRDASPVDTLLNNNVHALFFDGCSQFLAGPFYFFCFHLLGSTLNASPHWMAFFTVSSFASFHLLHLTTLGHTTFTTCFMMIVCFMCGVQDCIQCYLFQEQKKQQFAALQVAYCLFKSMCFVCPFMGTDMQAAIQINMLVSEYQRKLLRC